MNEMKKSGVQALDAVVKCAKDFCQETSMHGFNHVAAPSRHWVERVLWLAVTSAAIWGAVDISLGQWQRFNDNPTVVTLEKDFRSWQFSLPAITTCDVIRADPQKVPIVIKNLWNLNPGNEKYTYYEKFISVVTDQDLYHLEGYQEYMDDTSLNVDLYKLAVDVMPELQVKDTWSEVTNPPPKWTPTMTEAGACYTINSLAIADIAIVKPAPNNTKLFPMTCKYASMTCYVIMEILTSAGFYVHSPYDIVDITQGMSLVFPTLNRVTELSVQETGCGQGVRELSPRRRGCLGTDEPEQSGRQVYSTNSCRASCRSRVAVQLCGCKPFYYRLEDGPACNPAGMACLHKHSNILISLGGEKCACSQQCVDSVFKELNTVSQIWERGPFLNRASVRFTIQSPRTRYTREIVFHFQDLVVSFGGAAGLFLGASFISFVEIFYFILERLFGICIQSSPKIKRKQIVTNVPQPSYEAQRISELNSILERQKKFDGVVKPGSYYMDYY